MECNSLVEFEEDINRINLIRILLGRYEAKGTTNLRLLINHFFVFVNCFGSTVSERLLKYKIPQEFHLKLNALLVHIGILKFDGETEIDEEFFLELKKESRKCL
jgi:hypothetical protein